MDKMTNYSQYKNQSREGAPPPIGFNVPPWPENVQVPIDEYHQQSVDSTALPSVKHNTQLPAESRYESTVDKGYQADCTLLLFICLIPLAGFIIFKLVFFFIWGVL